MKKITFWIKKNIKKNRKCKCFCPNCEYYEICKNDGAN